MNFTNPYTLYALGAASYCLYVVLAMSWDYFCSDQSYERQLDLIAFVNPFALAFGNFGFVIALALAVLSLLLVTVFWPIPLFIEIRHAIRKLRALRTEAKRIKKWASLAKQAAQESMENNAKHRDLADAHYVEYLRQEALRARSAVVISDREQAVLDYLDRIETAAPVPNTK